MAINFSSITEKPGEENRENLTALNWIPADARQHRAMIAAVQSSKSPTSHVMSVAKFERFFRIAAGLELVGEVGRRRRATATVRSNEGRVASHYGQQDQRQERAHKSLRTGIAGGVSTPYA